MYATEKTEHTQALTSRLSANIRRLAEQQGIALAHLADHAGIGRTTLWRMLDVHSRGSSDPRLGTVGMLAKALGVDVAELLSSQSPSTGSQSPSTGSADDSTRHGSPRRELRGQPAWQAP